jgi:predicted homoserine dehydrogenase-like protein
MNLQTLLAARVESGGPVRAGLIGAGKFGSMFLAQVPSIKGLDGALICDRDIERASSPVKPSAGMLRGSRARVSPIMGSPPAPTSVSTS